MAKIGLDGGSAGLTRRRLGSRANRPTPTGETRRPAQKAAMRLTTRTLLPGKVVALPCPTPPAHLCTAAERLANYLNRNKMDFGSLTGFADIAILKYQTAVYFYLSRKRT